MTISYPLSMPTTPGMRRVTLTTTNVVGVLRCPFTMRTAVQRHQGAAWMLDMTLPPMERSSAADWIAFLVQLKGQYGTFLAGDPSGKTPRGTATGTPLVNGGSQTGETLATKGWTNSVTNILKKGDYIQVGQRLYQVQNNADSDGSGNTTLDIFPRLRESPANNDPITISSAKGLFRLAENQNVTHDVDEAAIFGVAFSAVEAF